MSSAYDSRNPFIPDEHVYTLPEELTFTHLSTLLACSTITVMTAAFSGVSIDPVNEEAHEHFLRILEQRIPVGEWTATELQLCALAGNCQQGYSIARELGEAPPREVLLSLHDASEILASLQDRTNAEYAAKIAAGEDDVPPWDEPKPDISDPLTEAEVDAVDFDKEWEEFSS